MGKLAVPLLKMDSGKKRWYVLKDKKLRCRAKGNNPKILLEMNLVNALKQLLVVMHRHLMK